jgi:hypothetical protein
VVESNISSSVQLQSGALAAWLVAASWISGPAAGQQPAANNPHAGEWSLEFRVSTRAGGEIVTPPGDTQTYNFLFQVAKESFAVPEGGAIKWEQRDNGLLHVDDYSVVAGKTWIQDMQPVLRLSGQATATLAGPGSPHTYDRKLSLQLAWTGGSGQGIDHNGRPFVTTLSADGNQWTTSGYTRGAPYTKSSWDLTPTSVEREEIAPDTIRETTTFRSSRQKALTDFMSPGFSVPVTERIEVKHIHYPRLVPRG